MRSCGGGLSGGRLGREDRKSTRLNSSHTVISYAVFCLKKEKHTSELQSHSDLVCRLLLEKKKPGWFFRRKTKNWLDPSFCAHLEQRAYRCPMTALCNGCTMVNTQGFCSA